jgi:BASS family bile acid:Na+ symporter
MSSDQLIKVLVTLTVVEMMLTMGLGVSLVDLVGVLRNGRLLLGAALANYVCVPAVTVGLVFLFGAPPMVAAGFLILAVCPGAPFGPPLAAIARADVRVAVGVMVILAASSALIAPKLLAYLLPLASGSEVLHVDPMAIIGTLLVSQLLPLGIGIAVRKWRPILADRLQGPGNLASKILNALTVCVILVAQFNLLMEIRAGAYLGMLLLLVASWAAGWLFGGPDTSIRKTMALTTALRNVGVGLVIATGSFAGTPAVTAALVYGLIEIAGSLLLALAWGRWGRPSRL